MISQPMLAGTCEDLATVQYPVLVTPKLDGFRCVKVNGQAISRKFLPIPNLFTRSWIEAYLPDGVDGELLVRHADFYQSGSEIGSRDGEPDFVFNAFDYVESDLLRPYERRMDDLARLLEPVSELPGRRLHKLFPTDIRNLDEMIVYEQWAVDAGFEGICIRSIQGPYKCGRSTEREGYLLKYKRWVDHEAVILRVDEMMHNTNAAQKDAFGRTKRSTAKAGKVGLGTFGAFWVRDLETGVEFSVSGGDRKMADWIWANRDKIPGRVIKYKSQLSGVKDKPRFPQFLCFREPWDMEGVA